MCSRSCLEFIKENIREEDVKGKTIIEIGARDVNGSCRPYVENMRPKRYIGVDIEEGPCVDEICYAENLVNRYGVEKFDIVISLECLEHIKHWKAAVSNFKRILNPNGLLIVTTRSKNFPYHGYPYDFLAI